MFSSGGTDKKQEDVEAKRQREEAEREYIEYRLREIAAWERKISGRKNDA